jgi:hypothetical protein
MLRSDTPPPSASSNGEYPQSCKVMEKPWLRSNVEASKMMLGIPLFANSLPVARPDRPAPMMSTGRPEFMAIALLDVGSAMMRCFAQFK